MTKDSINYLMRVFDMNTETKFFKNPTFSLDDLIF